jgi:calcineurin-like phosphoesterase family protein
MWYFSSDWHLGHEKVIGFSNRPFGSVSQMDTVIINNMTSRLKGGDEFFFLGDLSWNIPVDERFFQSLPEGVKFHWILGNHDYDKYLKPFEQYCASISTIKELKPGKDQLLILCHYPMISFNRSHHNSWQLYGHHHIKPNGQDNLFPVFTGKRMNVNCEFHDYLPVTLKNVEKHMEQQPDNWDYLSKKSAEME